MPDEITVAIFLAAMLILLLFILIRRKPAEEAESLPEVESQKHCPLCGSVLKGGERVHSVIYPGKPDKMMHIKGCRYCHGSQTTQKVERLCPVCKTALQPEEIVYARVFDRKNKIHVHVLGCNHCRRRKR